MANKKRENWSEREVWKIENVEVLQYTKICERGPHEKERDGYSEIEIALNKTQKNWAKEPKDRLCLLHYAYI